MQLAAGKIILPETPEDKNIPTYLLPILKQAEASLKDLLTPPMLEAYPKEAAKLQALYDCWVIEQAYGSSTERIYQCREKFYEKLNQLYKLGSERALVPIILSVEQPPVMIYFRPGSIELSEYSAKKIKSIAGELKGINSYDVTLNAYADNNENELSALGLAKKRGKVVKNILIKEGVETDNITIFAFADHQTAHAESDSRRYRSVEIVIDFLK